MAAVRNRISNPSIKDRTFYPGRSYDSYKAAPVSSLLISKSDKQSYAYNHTNPQLCLTQIRWAGWKDSNTHTDTRSETHKLTSTNAHIFLQTLHFCEWLMTTNVTFCLKSTLLCPFHLTTTYDLHAHTHQLIFWQIHGKGFSYPWLLPLLHIPLNTHTTWAKATQRKTLKSEELIIKWWIFPSYPGQQKTNFSIIYFDHLMTSITILLLL